MFIVLLDRMFFYDFNITTSWLQISLATQKYTHINVLYNDNKA